MRYTLKALAESIAVDIGYQYPLDPDHASERLVHAPEGDYYVLTYLLTNDERQTIEVKVSLRPSE